MAPRERRKSFDRINSINGQEGAQFNNEAPSNDDQPRPLDPPAAERDQEAIPLGRINHVISMMTLRRNSNPIQIQAAIPSPSAGRFQPADEPERRFERAVNMPPRRFQPAPESRDAQQEDQANRTLDTQPSQPDSSESPRQTYTRFTPSWMPQHPDDLWWVQLIVAIIIGGFLLYYSHRHWTDETPPANGSL
ncbi:uncharacterized protein LOC106653482 [Trichogramma pretiosum]|uniref:uncharacterized protein LOC106653482 n=1 Tax=Trichogramma pretiosum TaxID=7493 RepID=UPI0006C996C6|nr:uncharacterized protein LOC106653482 [Trichogramma pretiosum]